MPPEIEIRAAANMRRLRESRGLTQADLAELASKVGHDINTGRVWALETDRRRMNVADLAAIAEVFNVTCEQLLSADPDSFLGGPPAASHTVTIDDGTTEIVVADRSEDADGWLSFYLRDERVFFTPTTRVLCVRVASGAGGNEQGDGDA